VLVGLVARCSRTERAVFAGTRQQARAAAAHLDKVTADAAAAFRCVVRP
jgi:enamine deaminase RidA (YjgF/YER057c/UK114 family)